VISFSIVLILVPMLIGELCMDLCQLNDLNRISCKYIAGLIVSVAISEAVVVPLTLAKVSFSMFVWIYSGILAGISLLAVVVCRKNIRRTLVSMKPKKLSWKWTMIVLLVMVPVVIIAFLAPYTYGDDRTYLTMVNDMLTTNRLYLTDISTGQEAEWIHPKYALSAYWAWIAYLAKVTNIHPLILCKTVLPVLFVPVAYLVQMIFGDYLLKGNKEKLWIYMLLLILATFFGGFSIYTITYRIYVWPWQSKAFLAMIILPFLFYFCNLIFEQNENRCCFIVLFFIILSSCASTLTGTGISAAMVCILAAMYAFAMKKASILFKALIACAPAYALILLTLLYNHLLEWVHFYGYH
jgi:hypothetical protein